MSFIFSASAFSLNALRIRRPERFASLLKRRKCCRSVHACLRLSRLVLKELQIFGSRSPRSADSRLLRGQGGDPPKSRFWNLIPSSTFKRIRLGHTLDMLRSSYCCRFRTLLSSSPLKSVNIHRGRRGSGSCSSNLVVFEPLCFCRLNSGNSPKAQVGLSRNHLRRLRGRDLRTRPSCGARGGPERSCERRSLVDIRRDNAERKRS